MHTQKAQKLKTKLSWYYPDVGCSTVSSSSSTAAIMHTNKRSTHRNIMHIRWDVAKNKTQKIKCNYTVTSIKFVHIHT